MSGIITNHVRLFEANTFLNRFNSTDNLYLYIARITPWPNESSPPSAADTVFSTDYDLWRQIYAMKKVSIGNMSFGVPRYNWTTGTVYNEYRDNDSSLISEPFFVITSALNVYKCLYNNGGATSTVQPTGTSTSSFQTADGYIWKFLYQVSASGATTFLTPSFIPVQTIASNDGSAQWSVQQAAIPGSVEVIDVISGGTGFTGDANTASTASASTITLQTSAATGKLNGSVVYISSGTGAGQLRTITAWNGSTKVATISPNWTTTPDGTSSYVVGAQITVAGDGQGLTAYGLVSNTGVITSVPVVSKGNSYTIVSATASANGGSGANLDAYVSPRGGHGSDAVSELFGTNIIFYAQLNGTESNTISASNQYRVLGLILDPLLANGSPATGAVYDQTTHLTITSPVGTFTNDEEIVGQTSGATGYLVDDTSNVLRLVNVTGTFANAESVVGQSSSAHGTVSAISASPLKLFTGNILTVENRLSVSRSPNQAETFQIVMEF
jgi:hypothetical protein